MSLGAHLSRLSTATNKDADYGSMHRWTERKLSLFRAAAESIRQQLAVKWNPDAENGSRPFIGRILGVAVVGVSGIRQL